MATLSNCLFEAKYAENVETVQYASTNARTTIDKFTATNVTAGIVTITIRLVASGGSAAASNAIYLTKSLQPGECFGCPGLVNHTLEDGDFISTLASAASSIVIRASGRKSAV